MEWQSMLASVLGGDILKGESSRIGLDRPGMKCLGKGWDKASGGRFELA